jgi:predicted GNAT family acetyltransferase
MNLKDVIVVDNKEANRWEARLGDHLAVLNYALMDQEITLIHTGVPEPLRGQGVGAKLVQTALDQARQDGLLVIPRCPFAAAYIKRHPEYLDLVAHW